MHDVLLNCWCSKTTNKSYKNHSIYDSMFIASVYSRSLDILPTYQSVGSQEDYLYSFGAKDYSVRAKTQDYLVICPRHPSWRQIIISFGRSDSFTRGLSQPEPKFSQITLWTYNQSTGFHLNHSAREEAQAIWFLTLGLSQPKFSLKDLRNPSVRRQARRGRPCPWDSL
jgi:predicted phosphoadenosine phosphosulfate sulfurtransferase